jgi:hypothetical protein
MLAPEIKEGLDTITLARGTIRRPQRQVQHSQGRDVSGLAVQKNPLFAENGSLDPAALAISKF